MDCRFIRQKIGDGVRLRLDVKAGMEIDRFALHMMNRNALNHLIPVQMMQKDSTFYLQYDINAMQTLQNRLSGRLDKKNVMHILNSIIEAFEEVEDYMLTEDILVMDMNYVYFDLTGQCRFLCVPCRHKNADGQVIFLRTVVERMMTCYADTDTILYDLMNAYSRDGIKRISDMKDILRKLEDSGSIVENAAAKEEMRSVNQPAKNMPQEDETAVPKPISSPEKPVKEKQSDMRKASSVEFEIPGRGKSTSPVGFEIPGKEGAVLYISEQEENRKGKNKKEGKKKTAKKTDDKEEKPKMGIIGKVFKKNGAGEKPEVKERITVPGNDSFKTSSDMYESYEATVMVSDMKIPGMESIHEGTQMLGFSYLTGILVRKRTQEQFFLREGENVIGSGSAATCVISGNKAISRLHVIVKIEDDRISVTDNHSRNGTWVDGRKLIDGNTVFIGDRAVIKLADEEFVFTLKRQ